MITAAALTFPHLQACVTSLSGPCDAPVRQTVVTCSNAIQVTIYNCRINATGTATNAWFSVTDLLFIGLACLALHQAGIGSAWVRRR